jgi:MoaA/NifB/PqqE/SkfB family radical SAM enzyme
MHVKPNKDVHLCCRKSIPVGNLNDSTVDEVFYSSTMDEIRSKMLNGEKVHGCEKCYYEDRMNNHKSLRTFMNNWFNHWLIKDELLPWKEGFLDGITFANQNWTEIFKNMPIKIKWIAIHASNVCNLACRGCYSLLSTKWNKDEKKLGINPYPLQNPKLNDFGIDFNEINFITMYGGEPFYMKQNNELTALLEIDENISEKILQYFTNGMILPSNETLEVWKKVKKLQLIVSIDSYSDENDYFRYGSKWEIINKNLQYYITESKKYDWELRISTLINIYNVKNLDILHNWLLDQGIKVNNIDYNLCVYPPELDIKNLPKEYKDEVIQIYENISLPSQVRQLITTHIQSEPVIDFIAVSAFSNKLDEIRSQKNPIIDLKIHIDNI